VHEPPALRPSRRGRLHAAQREQRRGRDHSAANEVARSVDVAEQRLENPHPLRRRRGEPLEVPHGEEHRDRVEPPRQARGLVVGRRGARRVDGEVVDEMAGALGVEEPVDPPLTFGELTGQHRTEDLADRVPRLAQRAIGADRLVEAAGRDRVRETLRVEWRGHRCALSPAAARAWRRRRR
jgi:hypothetical protein